jgi:hypothetical protein
MGERIAQPSKSWRRGAPQVVRTSWCGQILYLVLEREREVHVLYVVWLELSD